MWVIYLVLGGVLWFLLGLVFVLLFWPKIADRLETDYNPRKP